MSSTGTNPARNSNLQSSQQGQEISRWSPSTPSVATNTTTQNLGPSRPGHNQEISRWSPDTSSGGTSAVTHNQLGIPANTPENTTRNPKSHVEAERERAQFALEHGGTPAPESARTAETFTSTITKSPEAAKLASSSGSEAQKRRRLQRGDRNI